MYFKGAQCAMDGVRLLAAATPRKGVQTPLESGAVRLTHQLVELFLDVFPLLRFGQCCLGLRNRRPGARKVDVDLDEVHLIGRHVFLGEDGVHRALGHANGAIDALVGVDDQEIWAFPETIYRAYINAIGVATADARFGDNVGHNVPINLLGDAEVQRVRTYETRLAWQSTVF
jgi:hypothetical protein